MMCFYGSEANKVVDAGFCFPYTSDLRKGLDKLSSGQTVGDCVDNTSSLKFSTVYEI